MTELESRGNGTHSADGHGKTEPAQDSAVPVNLRRMFPLAFRSIFRRSARWIAAYALLVVMIVLLQSVIDAGTEGMAIDDTFTLVSTTLTQFGVILLLGKLCYEYFYYRVFYYGFEMDHFVISRGVLAKTRGSFPLPKLTDVYVYRSLVDLVFGLHNISVTTPSPLTNQGVVCGLSGRAARALQQHILAFSSGSSSGHPDSKRVEEMFSEGSTTVDPTILGPSPSRRDPEVFQDPKRASNA